MTDFILSVLLDHNVAILLFLLITIIGLVIIAWPALQARKFRLRHNVLEEQVPSSWGAMTGSECRSNDATKSRPLLSIIIPAYNEEDRLPSMLASTLNHLHGFHDELVELCQNVINGSNADPAIPQYMQFRQLIEFRKKGESPSSIPPFELIIINDGSKDQTIPAVKRFLEHRQNPTSGASTQITVRILTLNQNSGKGAAIRTGMLYSSGHLCLMADADGATEISSGLPKLLQAMASQRKPMAFGSRAHLQQSNQVTRTASRKLLMHAFHFFVKALCSNRIQDTQCGFKLFTSSAAESTFGNLHLNRWAFDTEVIVIAERLHLEIVEVGVEWKEIEGSKLDDGGKLGLAIVSLGMLRDMLCVKVCYSFGFWKLEKDGKRGKSD